MSVETLARQFQAAIDRYTLAGRVQAAVERYAKKSKPAKGQGGFTFKEEDHPRDESGQFAEQSSTKSPPQEDEPFQLQPPKQKPKKAEFDDAGKGKQGGLFGLGKGEIKGQGLMFDDHFDPAAALEDSRKEKGKSTLDLPEPKKEEEKPAGEKSAKATDSPEFKKWFGESKIVNDKGEPLVVYHGTGADFDTFEDSKSRQRDNAFLGKGFYFSTYAERGSAYADSASGGSANVKPVYLNIKNPYMLPIGETAPPQDELISQGYDGVILDLGPEDPFWAKMEGRETNPQNEMEIVAFSPNQIKSATGNKGTFSPDDDRITYSRLTSDFQAAIDRYAASNKSCNWITLKSKSASGDSKGGAKVCIGDNGKITKGPAALKGKKLSSISGPKNAVDDSIRTGAKRFGVRKDDLKAAVDEVMAERMEVAKEQQELKRIAHKRAGIYPSDVEKLINRNLDWTSIKGFDKAAQELPMLDPRFNWPEDEAPERLWEFLREDAVVLPKKTDDDVIAEAGERLRASGTTRGKKRETVPAEDDDSDYVPFSRFRQDFERELYRRGVVAQN